MTGSHQKVMLVVLDGFGLSPIAEGNAILSAKTPFLDAAILSAPKTMLHASGAEVGLEWGEMGNSEVGHLNIGTGRIAMQDLPRINRAIEDGSFFTNQVMQDTASYLTKHKTATLHIVGLASTGGVHAHLKHMLAMLDFAKRHHLARVALHLISDGRDTAPKALGKDLPLIEQAIKKNGVGQIASLSGRYWAMDRDKHWDRTQKAYLAMVLGRGRSAATATEALELAGKAKESDEFITPTVISKNGKPVAPITKNDVVVFTNFRPDRARQLAAALSAQTFGSFKRPFSSVGLLATFTSYGQEDSPSVRVAFFAQPMVHQLSEVIAHANLSQFHIAETEKYAHVTYFFNGGIERAYPREERLLIPSPNVPTYDQAPAMSAEKITGAIAKRLGRHASDLIVVNFANPDMVGHTGNLKATIHAIQTVDGELATLATLARRHGYTFIVTADHGNAEQLINPETHEIDKEHTTNPVPCFLLPPDFILKLVTMSKDKTEHIEFAAVAPTGVLADIAPTILDLLNLKKPHEMTGQSLAGLLNL